MLTIVPTLSPGGTQRVAQNYTLGYSRAGYETAVLAYREGGPRADILREAGIPLFIGGNTQQHRGRAIDEAGRWNPDVIHIHRPGHADPSTAAMLKPLKDGTDKPLPVIETNIFGKPDYSNDRHMIDLHLHLTEWAFWKWLKWTRRLTPRPLGVLLPNLVDETPFSPASIQEIRAFRAQHDIPSEAFLAGRIGQPLEAKWSSIIIEGFHSLANNHPDAFLLLVGAPPSVLQACNRLPEPVRRRIRTIDFIHGDAALAKAYSSIDVFLHASAIGESFGLVLAESLLCQTPVITLSTPLRDNGQLELVGHEQGGLVVNDLDSMNRALERLKADPALRKHLGEQGAMRIKQRYTAPHVMSRLVAITECLIKSKDRHQLAASLETDRGNKTIVSDESIYHQLKASEGRVRFTDRLLMALIHEPVLYRIWQRQFRLS